MHAEERAAAAQAARSELVKAQQDEALEPGTRIHVSPHGEGSYVSFEKNWSGANQHTIEFYGPGLQVVHLKELHWKLAADGLLRGLTDEEERLEGKLMECGGAWVNFEITRKLGEGSEAGVWEAVDISANRQPLAIKVFAGRTGMTLSPREIREYKGWSAEHTSLEKLWRHTELLEGKEYRELREEGDEWWSGPGSKHIIELLETHEGRQGREFYGLLATERGGGDLFSKLNREVPAEQQARHYFRHILIGVFRVHKKGWAHRDLKLENVVFFSRADSESEEEGICKIIDFGCACFDDAPPQTAEERHSALVSAAKMRAGLSNDVLDCKERCGSLNYCAPETCELTSGEYNGSQADMYSCGVILYVLLYGKFPPGPEILEFPESSPESPVVSEQAQELIKKLLKVEPGERLTAEEALHDVWLWPQEEAAALEKETKEVQVMARVVEKAEIDERTDAPDYAKRVAQAETNLQSAMRALRKEEEEEHKQRLARSARRREGGPARLMRGREFSVRDAPGQVHGAVSFHPEARL